MQRVERAQAAGAVGPDRHARLVVLARPRLGQPVDPGAARPQDDGAARARGAARGRAGSTAGRGPGSSPDLDGAEPGAPGEPAPTFFGAYGEWMGTPPPSWEDLAWLREQWDGPFMLKGVMPRRRRPARRRRRRRPRSRSPTTAATTSTARRRRSARCRRSPRRSATQIEVAARRRHPPRQRRRQGARARRPRGDDRPRLPLGPRRQRPGRRRERARHPARRHRLGAARARPRLGRTTSSPSDLLIPRWLRPAPRRSTGLEADLAATSSRATLLVVPLGATEQHGPHLPLDTDT